MSYTLTINRNGQITIPAFLRKTLFKGGKIKLDVEEDEKKVVLTRQETVKEIFAEIDALREEEERKNPRLKELREENTGKTAHEMIDEYCKSEEGKKWLEEEYGV